MTSSDNDSDDVPLKMLQSKKNSKSDGVKKMRSKIGRSLKRPLKKIAKTAKQTSNEPSQSSNDGPLTSENVADNCSDSHSISDNEPLVSQEKKLKLSTFSSHTDDLDADGGEKGDKMRRKVAEMLESSSDSEDDKVTEIKEKQCDSNEKERKEKSVAESSTSGESEAVNDMPREGESVSMAKIDMERVAILKNGTDSAESSDTSINETINGENSRKKLKDNRKIVSHDKSSGKKKENIESFSFRLKKLKRCVMVAGLRFSYKKLFDGVDDTKKQIKILEAALHDKGVSTLTIEGCKNFRLKREEEQELAELSRNRIIEPESDTRVTRSSRRAVEGKKTKRVQQFSSSSSEVDSESEKVHEENMQIFSRLKGIVSDESD